MSAIQEPGDGGDTDAGLPVDSVERLDMALADREARLRSLEARLGAAVTRLADVEPMLASRPVRIALRARRELDRLIARVAPPPTRRHKAVRRSRHVVAMLTNDGLRATIRYARERRARNDPARVSPATAEDEQYRRWLARHQPTPPQLEAMRSSSEEWSFRPLVSVIVPVYNPDLEWLDAMVTSVLDQTYQRWELCLADDMSTAAHVRPALRRWAAADARIKVCFRESNGNIAAASNSALELAGGEFVALLDHDDLLRPHALHRVVELLQDQPDADLVYSDEDKILVGGARGQVHFKGAFDPDYLLSTNYVCHLAVARRSLVEAVGRFRLGFDGSQDHDLMLRVSERARTVRHIPDVLYSWKQVPGSAALSIGEKPAAWEAGRRAVEDAVVRRGPGGAAQLGPLAGTFVARYRVPEGTTVDVVVLGRDAATTARSLQALRSGAELEPQRWVVAGYDPGLEALRGAGVEVVLGRGSSHLARLLNQAVTASASDIVVFVSGDLAPAPSRPGWLHPLVEQAARDGVGVAGGRVTGTDGRVEQDGLALGGTALVESVGVRLPVIQRVSAVGVDCLAIRRATLAAAGGFDERYRLTLFDVDLCLRLRQRGLAVVYTPLTELRRLRGGGLTAPADDDARELRARWEGMPEWSNPYVSPWLASVTPFLVRDG